MRVVFRLVTVFVVIALCAACAGGNSGQAIGLPPTASPIPSDWITFRNERTETILIETLPIPLENCYGNRPATSQTTRERSTTTIVQLGISGEIEANLVPEIVKAKLSAQFDITEGETKSASQNVNVEVDAGTRVNYEVIWYETWRVGEVVISNLNIAPFTYRVRTGVVPELRSNPPQACPNITPSAVLPLPTNAPSITPLPPTPTPTPLTTETPIPTTDTATPPSSTRTDTPTITQTPNYTPTLLILSTPAPSSITIAAPASQNGTIETFQGYDYALVPEGTFRSNLISEFWIGVYEVTNEQFVAFLNSRRLNSSTDGHRLLNDRTNPGISAVAGSRWQVESGYENLPVVNVTWYGARDFCQFISARLPTSLEWKKAATWNPPNSEVTTYPWGDNPPDADLANYNGQVGRPTSVDDYAEGRSHVGAYNMAGNVAEWVSDVRGGSNRFWYGGSWQSSAIELRTEFSEGFALDNVSSQAVSFRCAVSRLN